MDGSWWEKNWGGMEFLQDISLYVGVAASFAHVFFVAGSRRRVGKRMVFV